MSLFTVDYNPPPLLLLLVLLFLLLPPPTPPHPSINSPTIFQRRFSFRYLSALPSLSLSTFPYFEIY